MTPDDRWDVGRIQSARVKAVATLGFTERQARFLVTVMLHAGVFVERSTAPSLASRTGKRRTTSSGDW